MQPDGGFALKSNQVLGWVSFKKLVCRQNLLVFKILETYGFPKKELELASIVDSIFKNQRTTQH
jgi:hypothetical protein